MLPLALLLSLVPAHAQEVDADAPAEAVDVAAPEVSKEAWEKVGWGWGGLPYVVYGTDDGVNVGIIGSVFRYDGKTAPYKTRIGGLVSFTSKGILYDYIDVDALGLAGGNLRLTTRVAFDSRFTEPFCGVGGDVTCSEEDARGQLDELDPPVPDPDEDTLRRWYFMAYRQPFALAWARYQLSDKPHRIELLGNYRLSYFHPFEKYPNTLFADEGTWVADEERGFTSVIQAGIMADNRDNEPSPFRGYWVEATVRGASKYWGSQFNWFGFNTTLRGYVPLASDGRLTIADRFVFDGIVGSPNTKELDWMGGYQPYNGAGGARSLRGIRQDRYRGKVKLINQLELRWRVYRWEPGNTTVDFYAQPFLDVAMVGAEWDDFGKSPFRAGEGLAVRVAINQNFILRGDFATSQVEGWGLSGLYLDIDNLF